MKDKLSYDFKSRFDKELHFTNQTLPRLLLDNRRHIELTLRKSIPFTEIDETNVSTYCMEIVKILLERRLELCISLAKSFLGKLDINELFKARLEYVYLLIFFIQEEAFLDPMVRLTFFLCNHSDDKKRLTMLLSPMIGKVEIFDGLSPKDLCEKLCAKVGGLTKNFRKVISLFIKQAENSHRKIKKGSAGINFTKDVYEYYQDRQSSCKTPSASHNRRIFKGIDLEPADEAILVLRLYNMSYADIGKILGKSKQAIGKRHITLWQNPEVNKAFEDKVQLFRADLEDNETGKSKWVKTSEFEDEEKKDSYWKLKAK